MLDVRNGRDEIYLRKLKAVQNNQKIDMIQILSP
jgi:hypothetical protein